MSERCDFVLPQPSIHIKHCFPLRLDYDLKCPESYVLHFFYCQSSVGTVSRLTDNSLFPLPHNSTYQQRCHSRRNGDSNPSARYSYHEDIDRRVNVGVDGASGVGITGNGGGSGVAPNPNAAASARYASCPGLAAGAVQIAGDSTTSSTSNGGGGGNGSGGGGGGSRSRSYQPPPPPPTRGSSAGSSSISSSGMSTSSSSHASVSLHLIASSQDLRRISEAPAEEERAATQQMMAESGSGGFQMRQV